MICSVGIITYNHKNYIRQCIDSILKQTVDFEHEIIIGDDCSSDGTQEILIEYQNRYPNIIMLLLNSKNEGISANYQNVFKRCSGKYVALCEGDDFWTDEKKLQKQIDFLECHQEYGFVGAYSQLLHSDGQVTEDKYDFIPNCVVENGWEMYGNVFDYAKWGPVTRTVSICFRRSLIEPYVNIKGIGNDMVLQTILAKNSFFAKYSRPMTMYRLGGVSSETKDIEKSLYYNDWYVSNRRIQKQLFPDECNWNEEELDDREIYIRLRDAISKRKFKESILLKRELKTSKYKKKKYSRLLIGPISCFLLSFIKKY